VRWPVTWAACCFRGSFTKCGVGRTPQLARAQQDIRAGNEKADGWLEERQAKDKQINELTITLREFMAVKV
jgi:hypothetical protein